MAKLFSFTICEAVTNAPAGGAGGVPALVAPQIALRPQFIPANFSFGVAVGIADINLKETNKVRFTITSPTGETVYDTGEAELPTILEQDSLPPEHQGFMMSADIRNMPIPSEGVYVFTAYINGEVITTQNIPVYKKVR